MWTWRWIEDAIRDARYAARSLARNPGFTATAVLSLAIGVRASAAIFSLVDQVLFRLLPVREPGRLVAVDWNAELPVLRVGAGAYMSYPLCRDRMVLRRRLLPQPPDREPRDGAARGRSRRGSRSSRARTSP
jgi:hypothetical protein